MFNAPNPYNNAYMTAMNYGSSMPQYQMQQQPAQIQNPIQEQSTSNAELIFINNIQQAREYMVPPNTIKYFLNTSDYELYAKSADSFGITNFKASKLMDFDPNVPLAAQNPDVNYSDLLNNYNALAARVANLENELVKPSTSVPDYAKGGKKNESVTKHDAK